MKRLRLLLLIVPLLLAGCETVNNQDREVLRAHEVSPDVYDKMLYGDPLTLSDVIGLSQRAVPPGLIIHYMDKVDTVYVLRKADVSRLRSAGVDEQVIGYMLSTAPQYGPGPYPYAGSYAGPYGGPYPYGPYPYGYYGGPYVAPIFIGGGYGYWGHRGWGHGGWGHGGYYHHH